MSRRYGDGWWRGWSIARAGAFQALKQAYEGRLVAVATGRLQEIHEDVQGSGRDGWRDGSRAGESEACVYVMAWQLESAMGVTKCFA